MYYVYILLCADNTLYTGITTDIVRRLDEHNTKPNGAAYTRGRRPVTLVYSDTRTNRAEASTEEARIKKLSRKEKILLIADHGNRNKTK